MNEPGTPYVRPNENDLLGFGTVIHCPDPELVYSHLTFDPNRAERYQQAAEFALAQSGADFDRGLHRTSEKDAFHASLDNYLDFMKLVVGHKIESMTADGSSDIAVREEAIGTLIQSNRTVLNTDVRYRLESSRVNRMKKRVALNGATRQMGKWSTYLLQGTIIFFVGKGFIGGESGHDLVLAASATAMQVSGRAFGQELAREANLQLDEYTPRDGKKQKSDKFDCPPLARHEAHISIAEGELYRAAAKYSMANEEDRTNMRDELIATVGNWFELYYKQPTKKDRIKLTAYAAATTLTAALTVAHL